MWELLHEDKPTQEKTARAAVPGGWLYRTETRLGVATTFVAEAKPIEVTTTTQIEKAISQSEIDEAKAEEPQESNRPSHHARKGGR